MKIGIIGGGVTGIAQAYYLAQLGHQVTIYEKQKTLGGLAAWFNIGGRDVERYYHFIMTCDKHYLDFLDELGLNDSLNWVETTTAFYHGNNIYPFSEPQHLLMFKPLAIHERLRLAGLLAYMTKISKDWRAYEERLACEWLPKWGGRKAWDIVFSPMLDMKFGVHRDKMSMAWLWARFNMVGQYREEGSTKEKRAWLKGSSRTFIERAHQRLEEMGVVIHCNADVQRIEVEEGRATGVVINDQHEPFDKIIFSASSTVLKQMMPESTQNDPYFKQIYDQKYYGVTCLVAALKKPFNPYFWTYVSDPKIPFVGIINYASFTEWEGQPGHNVIYVPWYSETNQEPYTTDNEVIRKSYIEGLKKVNPEFDESWIDELIVGRDPSAAMVCTGKFSERLVPLRSPIKDFWFCNLSQIYPQDRGISPGIKLARYGVRAVLRNEDVQMDFSPFASTEHVEI